MTEERQGKSGSKIKKNIHVILMRNTHVLTRDTHETKEHKDAEMKIRRTIFLLLILLV